MMVLRRLVVAASLGLMAAGAVGQKAEVAATPPMGWNSWDSYGLTITEPQFRENVKVLKEKLLPFGWKYAVIDEGWFFENPEDRSKPEKLHYALDKYGRYVPVPARFPSAVGPGGAKAVVSAAEGEGVKLPATIEETSFVALGKWVHSQGLKFGIHIVRGIPRASVERNLPVEGSKFRAQDVADQTDKCPWDPTNWGVKDTAAGQAWYDSLLRQYASWGVDLLKVDCIASHPYKVSEIRMIRRAIDKTGRPIVLSLSPGPTALENAVEVGTLANMWRISDDQWDTWDSVEGKFPTGLKSQFARLAAWEKYAKPGNWPDGDMLPLGELRPVPGWGAARTSKLTADEQRTEVTLWAMARSPLILGANLTLMDDALLKLLTNREVIAIDQTAVKSWQDEGALGSNGMGPTQWWAQLPDGRVALAFFNLGEKEVDFSYGPGELTPGNGAWGIKGAWGKVRDVWAEKDLGAATSLAVKLPPHGCALYLLR